MGSRGRTGRYLVWLAKLAFAIGLALRFVLGAAGKHHGVGRLRKLWLAAKIIRNNRKLKPLSNSRQHLLMIEQILKVPPSVPGDVVECGSFNGGSAANLSLACALTNRRLFVCDSFQGLPAPAEDEKYTLVSGDSYYQWRAGDYKSPGGLAAVKRRVQRYGNVGVCRFVKGHFADTLKDLDTDSIVMVFEDADLRSSVEQCLLHLWPKLQEGCRFYSHEPFSVEVVSLFYDRRLWKESFGTFPPGFYGASVGGVAEQIVYAGIGYAEKRNRQRVLQRGKPVFDRGSKGKAA